MPWTVTHTLVLVMAVIIAGLIVVGTSAAFMGGVRIMVCPA